jgi:hypothetical protein
MPTASPRVPQPEPSSAEVLPLKATDSVVLAPARATIVAGASVRIAASGASLPALTWSIFPRDTGSITAGEGGEATYTAPPKVREPMDVMVMAYGVEGAVGIGVARITVEPASG